MMAQYRSPALQQHKEGSSGLQDVCSITVLILEYYWIETENIEKLKKKMFLPLQIYKKRRKDETPSILLFLLQNTYVDNMVQRPLCRQLSHVMDGVTWFWSWVHQKSSVTQYFTSEPLMASASNGPTSGNAYWPSP